MKINCFILSGLLFFNLLVGECCSITLTKKPVAPIIDSVSVDPASGLASISWTQNPNSDVKEYKIFVFDPNSSPNWVEIVTISGGTNTFSLILGSNPSQKSETYGIAAVDFSGESTFSLLPHKTIHLQAVYSNCDLNSTLRWNKYINWNNGVKEYQILASENGGPYQLIGINASTDTSYFHSDLNENSDYVYKIRAIESTTFRSSSSNEIQISAIYPKKPAFLYIEKINIESDHKIELSCLIDPTAEVKEYVIKRQESGGNFEVIKNIDALSINGVINFVDSNVNTQKKKYTYEIVAIDPCGKEAGKSDRGNSILLGGENSPDFMTNFLNWNSYINWDGDVKQYNLYRSLNGVFGVNPFITLNKETTLVQDHLEDFYDTEGEFCYYVEAVENVGVNFEGTKKVKSNLLCIVQRPFFFIPNSFVPEGFNRLFTPVFSFIYPQEYSFQIINRQGSLIFETNDPYKGWDGTLNNSTLPAGSYLYYIKYKSSLGTMHSKSGVVFLLR